ncbi:hypothetical protein COLO4_19245 [Corchorus olitorius]|uniref:GATA-type domain-containing protein n=1 Tax=Corchorus olitorius TaxID=93759 RepID=A0A1R3J677_9ROSI|nr:hypothetical protein COLO4_19245 [Corchorus olitorius]
MQICNWISKEEEAAIQKIPIGDALDTDVQIWLHTKKGRYTVKSGYAVYKKNEGRRIVIDKTSSFHTIDPKIWKVIRRIDCPNKIRNFLWRVCNNCLATDVNLKRRHCVSNVVCGLCGEEEETNEHLSLGIAHNSAVNNDLLRKLAFTAWGIWKGRCERVLSSNQTQVQMVIKRIQQAELEWIVVNDCMEPNVEKTTGTDQSCGAGIVVRNANGDVLEAFGKYMKGSSTIFAEAMAVKEGVQFAINNRIRTIILDIQKSLGLIPDATVKVIKRTANAAAHWFAKQVRKGDVLC